MAPTFRHGKSAYLSVVSATGGTVNLSSGLDDAGLDRSVDTAEVTTFGDSDKNFIVGLRGGTISFAGHFASTYEEKLSALLGATAATAGNWIYGPESTSNTRRKLSGSGILTKFAIGSPVGDKVGMSGDILISGSVTATTF